MRWTHMHVSSRSKTTIIAALALLLSGCVYYPTQTERYDAKCDLTYKHLELASTEMTDACAHRTASDPTGAGCLGGVLLLGPMSAAASVSVIMVGNAVYWLDKEAQCMGKPNPVTAQAPLAASGVAEAQAQ